MLIKDFNAKVADFLTSPLFINRQGLDSFLLYSQLLMQRLEEGGDFSYKEETQSMLEGLNPVSDSIKLTNSFNEVDLPDNSIAFHRIEGPIFADYDRWGWFFSTNQFIDDLISADNNPKIVAHFLYTYTGGGEAYYLDKASEVLNNLKKPVIGFTYKYNCSAGYHFTCHADKLYAPTNFDTIGCIGTMAAWVDIIPYWEKLGVKYHEYYADQSTRKNKKMRDARDGKPDDFIKMDLNPMCQSFIDTVLAARPQLAKAPKEVLEGEDYYTPQAIEYGLIDGIKSFEEALQECYSLGLKHADEVNKQSTALNLLNS